jgi:predicted ATPase/Tfp pilus assembly protein PilF
VHAPATLARWLDRAAEASFIVTSRELLHLPGEEAFPVEPLPRDKDAIELFEARARAQRPDFVLGEDNRTAVVEVVRLLDGLPLAIELAAARIRIFSPRQLVARMKDRFQLLAGARGAAARQATLKAAIDWSWDLLAPWEQAALAQCAVFEGGFTMVAAEAVLDLRAWPEAPPAMDAVQALVDKSLLRTWLQAESGRLDFDEPYFGMYLSIHEYATDRLVRSSDGAEQQAQVRHGRYFAGLGADEGADGPARRGAVRRSRELSLEIDNLVVACRRALARGDGDTAVASLRAAWEVFSFKGPLSLAAELAPLVVAMQGLSPSTRARALATQAWVHWRTGRMAEAAAEFEQALQLLGPLAAGADAGDTGPWEGQPESGPPISAPRSQPPQTNAQALASRRAAGQISNSLGLLFHERGEHRQARQSWERALDAARELQDAGLEADVLGNRGLSCWKEGRYQEARQLWEAAVAMHRETGDAHGEGIILGNLAMLFDERSQDEDALDLYDQALQLHRAVGNRRFEAIVFGNLGCLHASRQRFAQARENFTAALALFREVGDRRGEGAVLDNMGSLDHDQGRTAQARAGLQTALAIHREVGNRALEGAVLGRLGGLLMAQGQAGEARQALTEGEALLRELGHRADLSDLLCVRGLLDVAQGRLDAAEAALDEAMATATALDMPEHSGLRRAIKKLQDALT